MLDVYTECLNTATICFSGSGASIGDTSCSRRLSALTEVIGGSSDLFGIFSVFVRRSEACVHENNGPEVFCV